MDTIVVGYDGSEHAQRALARAVEVYPHDTHVVVVSASTLLDPRPALVPHGVTAVEREVETESGPLQLQERDRVLEEARHLLSGHDGSFTFVEAFGARPTRSPRRRRSTARSSSSSGRGAATCSSACCSAP